MAVNWVLPVRAVQGVLSLVVLGLMGYVASWWSSHWRQMSPNEVNFMIFSPVWSILAVVILVVIPWKLPHIATANVGKIGLVALEFLTMVYWLSGFIALAVFLTDRICFGTVCSVAKAGVAIAAFNWVAFAVTTVYAIMKMVKGGMRSGGAATGEPKVEMHQGV